MIETIPRVSTIEAKTQQKNKKQVSKRKNNQKLCHSILS